MNATDPTTEQQIERLAAEVRRLKRLVLAGAIGLVVAGMAAFVPGRAARFTVLEAERLDIVHPDGKLALALAGSGRLPGPIFDGKQYPQEVSGGRTRAAGMIFFNQTGDEVGGLTYSGEPTGDGGHASYGGITFDQWKQDQVVSIRQSGDERQRSAGLDVWDRSTTTDIGRLIELVQARRTGTEAERAEAERALEALVATDPPGVHRVFLGSTNRTAGLVIRDTAGRQRLRVVVDSADVARIELLDAEGAVVHRFPE